MEKIDIQTNIDIVMSLPDEDLRGLLYTFFGTDHFNKDNLEEIYNGYRNNGYHIRNNKYLSYFIHKDNGEISFKIVRVKLL